MAELNIAEKLKKRGNHVVLYPNIDEYDILVANGDEKIKIDVKDYRNPRGYNVSQSPRYRFHT